MTTLATRPISGNIDRAALSRQVDELITRLYPSVPTERRQEDRTAAPALFRLIPLDAARAPIDEETITVLGKNISRRGFSFYHEQPVPYRRALVCLEHPGQGGFAAEIDITWTRFTKPGWYESGGRLVRLVEGESWSSGQ